jgi:hypothetical protein
MSGGGDARPGGGRGGQGWIWGWGWGWGWGWKWGNGRQNAKHAMQNAKWMRGKWAQDEKPGMLEEIGRPEREMALIRVDSCDSLIMV